MLKHKSKRVSYKPVYFIFALSLVLSIGFVSLRSYLAPQPVQILNIDPYPLSFGNTTVSGFLQKDLSGNYILALKDMRVIILDSKGLDSIVGKTVSISGYLSNDLKMKVYKITIIPSL